MRKWEGFLSKWAKKDAWRNRESLDQYVLMKPLLKQIAAFRPGALKYVDCQITFPE